jgi:hypothetical protein
MAYVGDSFGGATAAWQADEAMRQRAGMEAFNQLMETMRQRNAATQQAKQFQQSLAQNYALADAANQRAALMRSMQLGDRERGLDFRERQIQDTEDRYKEGKASKDYADIWNRAAEEYKNGTFDPKNYQGKLHPDDLDFFTRQQQVPTNQYQDEQAVAGQGNQLNRMQQDFAAPPLPTSAVRWYNPLTWLNSNPGNSGVQPAADAVARRAAIAQQLAPYLDPSAGYVNKGVTGGYIPASPRPASMRFIPNIPQAAPAAPQAGLTQPPTLTPAMGAPTISAGDVEPSAAPAVNWLRKPTPQALSNLRAHPETASQFNEVFGQGTAESLLSQW